MIISVFVMQYELRFVLEPATTGTAAEATSEASAATRTATAEASTTTTATRTARASEASTTAAEGTTTSEEVQTIDDVNHPIAGDGVILCIVARQGCDGTAEGGLLVQDIVELE